MTAYTDEIQPKMRRLVGLLQSWGYVTTDSGDGVTNVEAGMEGALDFPHVVALPRDYTENLMTSAANLHDELAHRVREGSRFHVEASYSTEDGISLLTVCGLTDKELV